MFNSVIFDKDGVLMETEEGKIRSYYSVLMEMIPEKKPEWEKYRDWHRDTLTGKSRKNVVEGIIQKYPSVCAFLLETRKSLKEKWESGHFNKSEYKEVKKEIETWSKNYDFDDFPPSLILSIHRLIKYADMSLEEKCNPIESMYGLLQSLQENEVPIGLVTESELERTKREL